MSGPAGQIRAGYQTAIQFGAWSLVQEPRLPAAYTFRAVVLSTHDYWSTQRPLDLVVSVGAKTWVWCGVEPRFEGGEVLVEIGSRPTVSARALG